MQFRTGTTSDNEPTFVWRDLQGDEDELYEFVAAGTNEPTRAFFETCMYRAMYERKYRQSADNTQDSDLQEFMWQYVDCDGHAHSSDGPLDRPPAAKKSKTKTKTSRKASASKSEPAPVEEVAAASSSALEPERPEPAKKGLSKDKDIGMPCIFAEPAGLHLWDSDSGEYIKQADVIARVAQNPAGGAFDYWLLASTDDAQVLAHKISSDMNQRLAPRVLSFTWNNISESGQGNSWCLQFETLEAFNDFQRAFSRALWEGLNGISWEKAKVGISTSSFERI